MKVSTSLLVCLVAVVHADLRTRVRTKLSSRESLEHLATTGKGGGPTTAPPAPAPPATAPPTSAPPKSAPPTGAPPTKPSGSGSELPALPGGCNWHQHDVSSPVETGSIPTWLSGTLYKALAALPPPFSSVAHDFNGAGGVLSVKFVNGAAFTSAAPIKKSTKYNAVCPHSSNDDAKQGVGGGIITIVPACGQGNICAQYVNEVPISMNADTLETNGAMAYRGDELPIPPKPMPPFYYASGHMPTDANGDSYSTLYNYGPKPAYLIYRVKAGTAEREIFANMRTVKQFTEAEERSAASYSPPYNHQGVAFTNSFVIVPDMPNVVGKFDWKQIYESWNDEGTLYFHLLDKKTGEERGLYSLPKDSELKYTEHNTHSTFESFERWQINAWETDTHVGFDLMLESNDALDYFAGIPDRHHIHDRGTYSRVLMHNPNHPGAPSKGDVLSVEYLTPSDGSNSVEFGVVNPTYMWKQPTRYIFGNSLMYNKIIRVNTDTKEMLQWPPTDDVDGTHFMFGAPEFVPESDEQTADSAKGVVLVYCTDSEDHPYLFILNGEDLTVTAKMKLPMPQMPTFGLHSHFSTYPTST